LNLGMDMKRLAKLTEDAGALAAITLVFIVFMFAAVAIVKKQVMPPLYLPANPTLCILAGVIGVAVLAAFGLPALIYGRTVDSILSNTPVLLEDLISSIRGGLTFAEALDRVAEDRETYGPLGEAVANAVYRMRFGGVQPRRALEMIGEELHIPTARLVAVILAESYYAGPRVLEILESSAAMFRKINEARYRFMNQAKMYSVILLLAFMVYVILAYVLVMVLLPAFKNTGQLGISVNLPLTTYSLYWVGYSLAVATGAAYGKIVGGYTSRGLVFAAALLLIHVVFYALFIWGPVRIPIPGLTPPTTGLPR